MLVKLIQVGKTEDKHLLALINNFEERLKHYIKYQTITIPEIKNARNLTPEQHKGKEGELILSHLTGQYIILLDEHGKEISSTGFANLIRQKLNDP